MKSALIAIGSLALGASALFYLDAARLRRSRDRTLPLVYGGPGGTGAIRLGARRPSEPGEVEEIVGSPGSGPSAG